MNSLCVVFNDRIQDSYTGYINLAKAEGAGRLKEIAFAFMSDFDLAVAWAFDWSNVMTLDHTLHDSLE